MRKNNKKKICFPFIGDSIGGSHKSTLILIEKLNLNFFDPIIVIHKKGPFETLLRKKKIKYKFLKLERFVGEKKGFLNFFYSILTTAFKLITFIIRNNIKIIHTNDTGPHLTWAIPAFITNRKLIWHLRNLYPKWKLFYFFSLFPKKILCISKFVKKSIPNVYKNKTYIILNPIDIKKTKKESSYKLNCKKKDFIIGFVANLWNRKKPFIFIELAKRIITKKNNVFFVIAGADREITKKMLKKEINKIKLGNKIQLLDFVDPIEPLLKSINLLFVPSINEPFGRTLIESMSVKTPVIANKSGGHIEIINNNFNGWFCDIDDMNEVANLVLKIIKNKKI